MVTKQDYTDVKNNGEMIEMILKSRFLFRREIRRFSTYVFDVNILLLNTILIELLYL